MPENQPIGSTPENHAATPPNPAGESGPPALAEPQDSGAVRAAQALPITACLAVAALLRFWEIDKASLWYDEVVTMRLARQPDIPSLVRLLFEIDATRAPLHPILLQAWLKLTGPSDGAGRAFSAVCGVLTVAVVYRIGREWFDRKVGIWAAWLLAVSPALVRYSREARMYSWLVLVSSLAWWLMLGAAGGRERWRLAGWAVAMAAIAYSHPLGLLMNAALMVGSLLVWKRTWISWAAVQAAWIAAFSPWTRFYFDHAPESVVDRASILMLLGMPIEFIGGDFKILFMAFLMIAWGWSATRDNPAWRALLAWLAIPPLILFTYSQVAHPLFGPVRYTVFVAPAYLLMVAIGLSSMPRRTALVFTILAALLSAALLLKSVYLPNLKADWRRAAGYLSQAKAPEGLVVVATDSPRNVEVETARYYLSPGWRAVPQYNEEGIPWNESIDPAPNGLLVFAVGVRDGQPIRPLDPAFTRGLTIRFPGLNLTVIRSGDIRDPGPDRTPDR